MIKISPLDVATLELIRHVAVWASMAAILAFIAFLLYKNNAKLSAQAEQRLNRGAWLVVGILVAAAMVVVGTSLLRVE
jgi:hypothetical protein